MRWSMGVLGLALAGWVTLQAQESLVPEAKAKVDILFTLPLYIT